MKSILIYFFVFGLQFVGCLNEDTEITLENGGDEKQALVAMPQGFIMDLTRINKWLICHNIYNLFF